jgi:hypothetical protein
MVRPGAGGDVVTGVSSVPLPEPKPGHHWEERPDGSYPGDGIRRAHLDGGEGPTGRSFHRFLVEVPDPPPWPTIPGEHKMTRLSDGQTITALLDRHGWWNWLDANGDHHGNNDSASRFLRPAGPVPAWTDEAVEAAAKALRKVQYREFRATEMPWEQVAPSGKDGWLNRARAALDAATQAGQR